MSSSISEKEKRMAEELSARAKRLQGATLDAECTQLGCGSVSCSKLICGTFGAVAAE